MSRKIYDMKLNPHIFPAVSVKDALEMQANGSTTGLSEDDVDIRVLVDEEGCVKLFSLGRSMYASEQYEYDEIKAALLGLCNRIGCEEPEDVVEAVCTWCERLEDLDDEEFNDWLMASMR